MADATAGVHCRRAGRSGIPDRRARPADNAGTEGDIHANQGTCTGELSGSVFRGYGFSRDQASGGSSKPGSISLSEFTRLYDVLLPQRQSENSEA
jgi:hypothetical protein